MKKSFTLYTFLFFWLCSSLAQVSFEQRIELSEKDAFEEQKIYSFGEKGFVLHAGNEKISKAHKVWKYTFYDTSLQTFDSTLSFLPRRQTLRSTYRDEERNFVFFLDKKGNFSLEILYLNPYKVQSVKGKIPRKTHIRGMVGLKNRIFLMGESKKSPFIYTINWQTGEQTRLNPDLDSIDPKTLSLKNFQVLPEANEALLFFTRKIRKNRHEMYFLSLNEQGEMGRVNHLSKVMVNNIIDASASKIAPDHYILTGTYSSTQTNESEGLYFCEITPGKGPQIKYYKFIDLHNFLSYLPARKAKRIKRKKKRKEKAGKDFKPNYRIASHEIIPVDDGYIYLGEAYYPTYDMQQDYFYCPDGTGTGTFTYTFDGYQYTHAVIAKFDKNQQLLWDESFEMWPSHKPFGVRRFISIAEQDLEQLKLIFTSHNRIRTKTISLQDPDQQFTEKETFQTPFEGDKAKRTFSNIDFWYDKYFIAFGNQKIKNKTNENSPKKRKVFFVSKIGFE